jgi:hypothetical protein
MKSGFETKRGDESAAGKPVFVPPPVEELAKLFPQLEIMELLGRGGMGAVYKARQLRLNRLVALKILSPEKQNDPQFAERFEREARALASLTHPNIVAVYDFGEVQGRFYLLMEFVDGPTLRQLLQARKLAPAEALGIVPKICEALQYAHEQGVIHRDIKPENILLDQKGQVKITDFGIAKILDLGPGDLSLTGAKDVMGTPHYMAPEQIEKPQTVDGRADIFSLGVVFYEMLTGELPLGKFPPPSQKAPVDVRVDEVVLHTLEKEPERRYQQASEVKTDVETIARTIPPPVAQEAGAFTPPQPVPLGQNISDKTILPAFLLAFFLGFLGAHRFYVGKPGTAILQLLTCGGFGFWAFIDWILILCKVFTDGQGRRIVHWTRPDVLEARLVPPKPASASQSAVPTPATVPASSGMSGWKIAVLFGFLGVLLLLLLFSVVVLVVSKTEPSQAKGESASVSSNASWNLLNESQRSFARSSEAQFQNLMDARTFDGWPARRRADLESRMMEALQGQDPTQHYQAIGTLAALHSTNALPVLRQMAFDPANRNNRDRWLAARAMGIIGDQSVVPQLIHLLYHYNRDSREWAQISLVRLTGQNFGENWQAWGNWWNSQNGQPPFNPEVIPWSTNRAGRNSVTASHPEDNQTSTKSAGSRNTPVIDDDFWLKLDRRNYQRYRTQLNKAPHVLVVRPTHYSLNALGATGIGAHYGWMDGKMGNLCVTVSELFSYAYSQKAGWDERLITLTEFPPDFQGMTNQFDVIDTLRVQPVERLQTEIKRQLQAQFGLSWHREIRDTAVFLIVVKDPQVLESHLTGDFAKSQSMPGMAGEWENYFGKPVLDETGMTNRYDREIELIPAAYIPGRTLDLDANNAFLARYGLELVRTNEAMEWLALDRHP